MKRENMLKYTKLWKYIWEEKKNTERQKRWTQSLVWWHFNLSSVWRFGFFRVWAIFVCLALTTRVRLRLFLRLRFPLIHIKGYLPQFLQVLRALSSEPLKRGVQLHHHHMHQWPSSQMQYSHGLQTLHNKTIAPRLLVHLPRSHNIYGA